MKIGGHIARANAVGRVWARHAVSTPFTDLISDFGRWTWTTFVDSDLLSAQLPWTTFGATRWLTRMLRPDMRVFEWGCGGSTLFFARRVRSVVSVEHDPKWYTQVAQRLTREAVGNVDLRLVLPQPLTHDSMGTQGRSSVPQFSGMHFTSYVESIATEADDSLDLVLIDGRARASCSALARAKVRRTGALVLDDSDRADTAAALTLFEPSAWKVLHFAGPGPVSRWPVSWRTSVFIKQ